MDIERFIVAWCSYGEWKTSMPFTTEKRAQEHIDKVLCTPDRDYNKHAQIIPVILKET